MNRVVIITGASSGIGAATARVLAEGYRLALVGRSKERLGEVVQQVVAAGGQAHGIVADLGDAGVPIRVVDQVVERFGGIDAVVNNAGVFETGAIGAITPEHLDRLWRINAQAPMLLTQAALPHLRGRRGGTIVNISSHAARAAFTGNGAYAATKAALEAWSRCLREELRGTNVRVGVVSPGATDTPAWGERRPDPARLCRAEDVAQAIRAVIEAPASASLDFIEIQPPGGPI